MPPQAGGKHIVPSTDNASLGRVNKTPLMVMVIRITYRIFRTFGFEEATLDLV